MRLAGPRQLAVALAVAAAALPRTLSVRVRELPGGTLAVTRAVPARGELRVDTVDPSGGLRPHSRAPQRPLTPADGLALTPADAVALIELWAAHPTAVAALTADQEGTLRVSFGGGGLRTLAPAPGRPLDLNGYRRALRAAAGPPPASS